MNNEVKRAEREREQRLLINRFVNIVRVFKILILVGH